MREREVKLAPAPGFRLPDLTGVVPGVETGASETIELQATYFDTADLRLVRAGASLRHRSDEGWTVKLPEPGAHDDLLVRGEHHFDGPTGAPPTAALDLVLGFVRTAPVQAVGRLRTRRNRVELLDADGKPLGEVVDDVVSVLDGRRLAARFRELEVELREDTDDDLASAVVERLRTAGAGEPDPTPKVVRALGPRAVEPPDVSPPESVSGDAGTVVRAALAASVARLLAHDPGVRLGEDPEAVHQARVATRRLRSDLRTFRPLLDEQWAQDLRDELKWLGTALGAVRDADVLLDRLRRKIERLPDEDRKVAARFVERLGSERNRAREELLVVMRGTRYLELLERLVDAARTPALVDEAEKPADSLAHLARKPWKRLAAVVDELDEEPSDEALHDVRKRAKRLRYAAEAVAPVVGKPARRFAAAIEDVQDLLGEHQDAVVSEEWLRTALAAASPRETFVTGQLVAMEQADAAASRAQWPAVWKAAGRKRLRTWL
ncbi:MAG: CHAD domain-containing protein [Acidimicrobiia bacterium]